MKERRLLYCFAAAKEAMDAAPAPAEPEPVGDINDLHALFEKQKEVAARQTALKEQEADLLSKLQSIREQSAELERQTEAVKARAATLFETLFGKPERSAPPPRQIPQKPVEVSNAPLPSGTPITSITSLSL